MSEIRNTVLIIYFNSITADVGPSRVGQYYIALKTSSDNFLGVFDREC